MNTDFFSTQIQAGHSSAGRAHAGRALASQHRYEQVQRVSRFGRSMLMLAATVLSFAVVGLLLADQLYRPDAFKIDQLKIVGRFTHIQPQSIEVIVNQKPRGNFFSIELNQLKSEIEQLPWVQSVEVRRQWPGTLLIDVSEQQPAMRWNDDKWINTQGQVIALPDAVQALLPIRLYGNKRDSKHLLTQAIAWQQKLRGHGMQLTELRLSDSQAYHLKSKTRDGNNEFELLLGSEEVERRLDRFLLLYATQFNNSEIRLTRVDARYPNGLAVNAERVEPAIDALAINQSSTQIGTH